jgi:hypothetical protein
LRAVVPGLRGPLWSQCTIRSRCPAKLPILDKRPGQASSLAIPRRSTLHRYGTHPAWTRERMEGKIPLWLQTRKPAFQACLNWIDGNDKVLLKLAVQQAFRTMQNLPNSITGVSWYSAVPAWRHDFKLRKKTQGVFNPNHTSQFYSYFTCFVRHLCRVLQASRTPCSL